MSTMNQSITATEIEKKFKTNEEMTKLPTAYLIGYVKRLRNYRSGFYCSCCSQLYSSYHDRNNDDEIEVRIIKNKIDEAYVIIRNRSDYEEVLQKKIKRQELKLRRRKMKGCQRKTKGKRKTERNEEKRRKKYLERSSY